MGAGAHPSDEQLFDLASGTLSRADRAVVEQHVAACERCSADVADATTVARAAASAGDGAGALERMPEVAATRMHEAIVKELAIRSAVRRAAQRPLPGWRRVLNLGLAFGVAGAMIGVSVNVLGDGGTAMQKAAVEDSAAPTLAGGGAAQEEAPASAVAPTDEAARGVTPGAAEVGGDGSSRPGDANLGAPDTKSSTGAQPPVDSDTAYGDDGTVYDDDQPAAGGPCVLVLGSYAPPSGDVLTGGFAGVTEVVTAGPVGTVRFVCVGSAGSGATTVGSVPPQATP